MMPAAVLPPSIVGELAVSALVSGDNTPRDAEVENLDRSVGPDLDVCRLQIAVDDVALVRGLEPVANLDRDRHRIVERQRAFLQSVGERIAVNVFHHDDRRVAVDFDAEYLRDRRMVERREHLCFALESTAALRIADCRRGQDLEGDVALQPRVMGAKTSPMPPSPIFPTTV